MRKEHNTVLRGHPLIRAAVPSHSREKHTRFAAFLEVEKAGGHQLLLQEDDMQTRQSVAGQLW